jgi:hypothetical protein
VFKNEEGAKSDAPSDAVSFFQIVLCDKIQSALFQYINPDGGGTAPIGLNSYTGLAQQLSPFRDMKLTKLFGDSLAELPGSTSLCISNACSSGSGGHSLQNSVFPSTNQGINAFFEKQFPSNSGIGPVIFNVRSDANDAADAAVGTMSYKPEVTPPNANSVTLLQHGLLEQAKSLSFKHTLMQKLDLLKPYPAEIKTQLTETGIKLENTITKVLEASSQPQYTNFNGEVRFDFFMAQVNTVIELQKAGLSNNFSIGLVYDDTNGGGNLTNPGGEFGISPYEAVRLLARGLVAIHKAIPNAVCVSVTDGGRTQNNADQALCMGFMTAPSTRLKNGVLGNQYLSTYNDLSLSRTLPLSSGTTGLVNTAQWLNLALKVCELDAGLPIPNGALVT